MNNQINSDDIQKSREQEVWITPQQLLDSITRVNEPELSNMTYQNTERYESSKRNQSQ